MTAEIKISPAVDPAALNEAVMRQGRVHIPAFFENDSAQRIYDCLRRDVPWCLTYNEGANNYEVSYKELSSLTPQQQQTFMRQIIARARNEFQFVYDEYAITDAYKNGWNPGHFLHKFFEFVNSGTFLDFARALTGIDTIAKADAHATLYRPGHFLCSHDDKFGGHKRVAAYVMNFTPDWRADWGGNLLFVDGNGHISGGIVPTFNAMNLFCVPQQHIVSMVAPYATVPRLSITGWLMKQ